MWRTCEAARFGSQELVRSFALLGLQQLYALQGMTPDRVRDRKVGLARWVREGLIKLGPTFIKIGQQFSTRVDVLSPEFVKELESLQV